MLAALRASNTGVEVIVATSDDASDDALAAELHKYEMRVVRGPLHDVLERFQQAADSLPENHIVVRLTGDNVVPDGHLVQELASALDQSDLEYLSQPSPQSRLPYGLGGEAFRVATLRRANSSATSAFDREHVGPWMQRNCRSAIHSPSALGEADFSHLRCTLDDEEDYRRVVRLFERFSDPLRAGWVEFLHALASLPGEPKHRVPYRVISGRVHSQFTLGTAQLGFDYGIMNQTGKPSRHEAIKMIQRGIAHGITTLDTARGYGDAEEVVGVSLSGAWRSRVEVITKLDPLTSLNNASSVAEVLESVDRSIAMSCQSLGVDRLSTVLLHGWPHHDSWGGAVWRRLSELRAEGKIGCLGVSVYEPGEAIAALEDPLIQHLQLPMNVLDWRWKAAALDCALMDRPDVIVHARSALLQGILAHAADRWPPISNVDTARIANQVARLAKEFARKSVADLCIAFVRSQLWITSVIIGCETLSQLDENLDLFRTPMLTQDQCEQVEQSLSGAPEALLNPTKWNTHERAPIH